MTESSYSEGVLLWVDDHLEIEELRLQNEACDLWTRTFGSAESRIFRLLGLHLEIATSYQGALEAVEAYRAPEWANTFVTAVIDLRVPYDDAPENAGPRPAEEPCLDHGLHLGARLQEEGIPVRILSAKQDATDELARYGLETVPYYRKQTDQGRPMMPEELARSVLNDFRNTISWINLSTLHDGLGGPAGEGPARAGPPAAHHYFPFFGPFRDFVERWEYRPLPSYKHLSLVLRAPSDHSDAFIGQCVLITLSQFVHAGFLKDADLIQTHLQGNRALPTSAHGLAGNRQAAARIVAVVRLDPGVDRPEDLQKLVRERQGGITVYIIPNDERGEPFLDVLPRDPWTVYDDLPAVRRGAQAQRTELIRKTAGFVFQGTRLQLDDEQEALGLLYRENPEMLMHPVNWVALLEAENVAAEISDPYEVLSALLAAARNLERTPEQADDRRQDLADKERLRASRPLAPGRLLPVASEVVGTAATASGGWVRAALEMWLRQSWQFPYGVSDRSGSFARLNRADKEAWEDFCLNVVADLAETYRRRATDNPDLARDDLDRVVAFLAHPAIKALIAGEIVSADQWSGLEGLRWPHGLYPMPTALSRQLKRAGRYLWVQSDFLDVAMVLPVGSQEYRGLDVLVSEQQARLEWLQDKERHLPVGWRQPLQYLTDIIAGRRVREAWQDAPGDVWGALMGFQRNALRLSTIVHLLLGGKPVDKPPANKKEQGEGIRQQVAGAGGSGELVGKVRGHRRAFRGVVLSPHFEDSRLWKEAVGQLAHFARMGEGLRNHLGPQAAEERLQAMSHSVARMIQALEDADAGDDGFDGRERHTAFHRLMHFLDETLADESWFPGQDKDTGAGLFTDPAGDDGERFPIGTMPSLFGTRGDFLWQGLDATHYLRQVMMGHRYYDGYAFLAGMVDLRNAARDQQRPAFRVPVIEEILQILVWSAEGLVAQLKLALRAAGRGDLADAVPLNRLALTVPEGFPPVTPDQFAGVFQVAEETDGYGVYIPGLAGGRGSQVLAEDVMGTVRRFADTRQAAE